MFHKGIAIFEGSALARSLLIGAAAAMTASTAMAGPDCQTMIRSFDQVVGEGGKAAKVAEAKKSRKAGAAALASGNEKACLKHLVQAHASISQAQNTMAIEEPDTAQ
jgi:hypothetical protein